MLFSWRDYYQRSPVLATAQQCPVWKVNYLVNVPNTHMCLYITQYLLGMLIFSILVFFFFLSDHACMLSYV